jgi:hypothetical protein
LIGRTIQVWICVYVYMWMCVSFYWFFFFLYFFLFTIFQFLSPYPYFTHFSYFFPSHILTSGSVAHTSRGIRRCTEERGKGGEATRRRDDSGVGLGGGRRDDDDNKAATAVLGPSPPLPPPPPSPPSPIPPRASSKHCKHGAHPHATPRSRIGAGQICLNHALTVQTPLLRLAIFPPHTGAHLRCC